MPSTNGGSDSSAKNAASPASPVTRKLNPATVVPFTTSQERVPVTAFHTRERRTAEMRLAAVDRISRRRRPRTRAEEAPRGASVDVMEPNSIRIAARYPVRP
ncbi:hypothetical protein Sru01_55710 [Sphaerisporangium rufum]|uniref:Uncharacterized protein n=1 Tax=Sphaerisporangium rufum TaxID=1381558 RepID=A0A919R6L6_9ACTN|nr:hypothetical protein Sru01_55710 [Sphaerisporangium rufum]